MIAQHEEAEGWRKRVGANHLLWLSVENNDAYAKIGKKMKAESEKSEHRNHSLPDSRN